MESEFLRAYNKEHLDKIKQNYYNSEVILREVYFKSVKEALEMTGIETYSIQQIQGMTLMLENYVNLESQIKELKVNK